MKTEAVFVKDLKIAGGGSGNPKALIYISVIFIVLGVYFYSASKL